MQVLTTASPEFHLAKEMFSCLHKKTQLALVEMNRWRIYNITANKSN